MFPPPFSEVVANPTRTGDLAHSSLEICFWCLCGLYPHKHQKIKISKLNLQLRDSAGLLPASPRLQEKHSAPLHLGPLPSHPGARRSGCVLFNCEVIVSRCGIDVKPWGQVRQGEKSGGLSYRAGAYVLPGSGESYSLCC